MPEPMHTLEAEHVSCRKHGQPVAYWGERGHWLLAAGTNRDADSINRSNFRSLLSMLGGESDTVQVERESHWACGWIEYLLIDPADTDRVAIANKVRAKLEDYPVVSEEDLSNLEWEESIECVHCYLPCGWGCNPQKTDGWPEGWEGTAAAFFLDNGAEYNGREWCGIDDADWLALIEAEGWKNPADD